MASTGFVNSGFGNSGFSEGGGPQLPPASNTRGGRGGGRGGGPAGHVGYGSRAGNPQGGRPCDNFSSSAANGTNSNSNSFNAQQNGFSGAQPQQQSNNDGSGTQRSSTTGFGGNGGQLFTTAGGFGGSRTGAVQKCFNCHQTGHKSNECPEEKGTRFAQTPKPGPFQQATQQQQSSNGPANGFTGNSNSQQSNGFENGTNANQNNTANRGAAPEHDTHFTPMPGGQPVNLDGGSKSTSAPYHRDYQNQKEADDFRGQAKTGFGQNGGDGGNQSQTNDNATSNEQSREWKTWKPHEEKGDESKQEDASSTDFGSGNRGFGSNTRGGDEPFGNKAFGNSGFGGAGGGNFGGGGDSSTGGNAFGVGGRGGRKCFNCGEPGHDSRECTNPKKAFGGGEGVGRGGGGNQCFNCKEEGHMSRDCPKPRMSGRDGGSGGNRVPLGACRNCNQEGHYSRDCPEPRNENNRPPRGEGDAGGGRNCFNCNQPGHISRECPNKNGGGGGRDGDGDRGFFGQERRQPREFMTEEERAREQPHVPVERPLEEIYGEDKRVADTLDVADIHGGDEDIAITGNIEGVAPTHMEAWGDVDLQPQLLKNIEAAKYIRPRKIQAWTIPLIMEGHDIKGHAETGSGKTAAFLIPLINKLMKMKEAKEIEYARSCPYVLVVEPTRELAIQLFDQARKLANDTGITVARAYGKFSRPANLREISKGCDILIGTTGRLRDFFCKTIPGEVMAKELKVIVFDEADKLLEDGFMPDMRAISAVDGFPKMEDRQTLMFSATFPTDVHTFAQEWIKKNHVMVTNKKMVSANARVIQAFELVCESDKKSKLLAMLKAEMEEARKARNESGTGSPDDEPKKQAKDSNESGSPQQAEASNNLNESSGTADTDTTTHSGSSGNNGGADAGKGKKEEEKDGEEPPLLRRTLVFVKLKRTADLVANFLEMENIKAGTINGDRPQANREKILDDFRKNKLQVVVATDVCARGIDIKDLDHVINMDLPDCTKEGVEQAFVTYVHRIGRTGRLKEGRATSFFDPDLDIPLATKLIEGLTASSNTEIPQFLVDAREGKLFNQNEDKFGGSSSFHQPQQDVAGSVFFNFRANADNPNNDDDWE